MEAYKARRELSKNAPLQLLPPSLLVDTWRNQLQNGRFDQMEQWASYLAFGSSVCLHLRRMFFPLPHNWTPEFLVAPYWTPTREGLVIPGAQVERLRRLVDALDAVPVRSDLPRIAGQGIWREPTRAPILLFKEGWGNVFKADNEHDLALAVWQFKSGLWFRVARISRALSDKAPDGVKVYKFNEIAAPVSQVPHWVARFRGVIDAYDMLIEETPLLASDVTDENLRGSIARRFTEQFHHGLSQTQ